MAKQAPAPATASKAAEPATPSIHSARFAAPAPATGLDRGSTDVKVIKWGNGKGSFVTPPDVKVVDMDPNKGTEENAGGGETNTEQRAATTEESQKVKEDEPGEVTRAPKDGEAPKKTSAEKRRDALANLESERKVREIEAAAKATREELAALKKQLEDSKKAPLRERIASLGIDREELLERLLKKDADLEPVVAKPKDTDPEIQALRDEIKQLKEAAEKDKGTEEQRGVQRAVAGIAEQLKDADLPLTNSDITVRVGEALMSPHMMVLQVAHQMWLDSGKSGHPRDYVDRSAKNVEAHLREKFPALAKRLGAASDPKPAAGKPVGTRTGSGARGEPKTLPMDKHQRDQEIKREMGWT